MAYNNYYPQFYPNANPIVPPIPQPTSQNGITWVQGENAAKSYPVGAGQSVLLMDSENAVMYIKSTDQSGVPLPLRIFDYTERTEEAAQNRVPDITREEFEELRAQVRKLLERKENSKYNKDKGGPA